MAVTKKLSLSLDPLRFSMSFPISSLASSSSASPCRVRLRPFSPTQRIICCSSSESTPKDLTSMAAAAAQSRQDEAPRGRSFCSTPRGARGELVGGEEPISIEVKPGRIEFWSEKPGQKRAGHRSEQRTLEKGPRAISHPLPGTSNNSTKLKALALHTIHMAQGDPTSTTEPVVRPCGRPQPAWQPCQRQPPQQP